MCSGDHVGDGVIARRTAEDIWVDDPELSAFGARDGVGADLVARGACEVDVGVVQVRASRAPESHGVERRRRAGRGVGLGVRARRGCSSRRVAVLLQAAWRRARG